jgi:hypothetical protein
VDQPHPDFAMFRYSFHSIFFLFLPFTFHAQYRSLEKSRAINLNRVNPVKGHGRHPWPLIDTPRILFSSMALVLIGSFHGQKLSTKCLD